MASGISPKLPLSISSDDGAYTLNKTIEETVQQNLKMLLLTAPGERIFDLNYGVGIRNYLFENTSDLTYSDLKSKIYEQVGKYMPFIELTEVIVSSGDQNDPVMGDGKMLYLRIRYRIIPLDSESILELLETT